MASGSLTEQRMVEILEEIATQQTNAAARIAAIKQLMAMRAESEPADRSGALDELASRRAA
jgi:hypothetical protein